MTLIIGFLLFVGGIIIVSMYSESNSITFPGLSLLMIGELLIVTDLIYSSNSDKPTAIDVYRGNTTLEITYRDSIPVDTVVVFKKK